MPCIGKDDKCNPSATGLRGSPRCCEPTYCEPGINKCVVYEPMYVQYVYNYEFNTQEYITPLDIP